MTGEAGASAARSFAIIGTGALGIYYGGHLHRSGARVTFLPMRGEATAATPGNEAGTAGVPPGGRAFTIESPAGDIRIDDPRVVHAAEDVTPCDVAVICLKTTQNHLLPALLPCMLKPGGTVVFLQNGLGVEGEARAVVAAEQILVGSCYLGVEKIAPDRIRHLDGGRIVLGQFTADGSAGGITGRMLDVASDFKRAGIPVQPTDDLLRAQWQKLLWNIPFNGLSVVLDMTPHEIVAERHQGTPGKAQRHESTERPANRQSSIVNRQSEGMDRDPRQLVETIMREVLAAARATGHPLPEFLIPRLIAYTRSLPPFRTSMRMDYERGRSMELRTMYENPLRLARQHGVEMPATESLWRGLVAKGAKRACQP